jgi:hypothetical protein
MLGAVVFALGPRAEAQLRRPRDRSDDESSTRSAVSFMAGPSSYDLAGTGTGFAGTVRFDAPSGRVVIFEPGVTFFHYTGEFGNGITYVIPEVSVQVQAPSRSVRPYIGAGAGFAEFLSGRGSTLAALHVTGGLRIDAGPNWGGRGEIRLRSIDPFKGNTTDLLVGVMRRLGSSHRRDR